MECSSTEGAPTLLAEGRALLVSLPVNPCSRVGIGSLGQAPSEALSPRSARRRERCSIHEHQSSSTCLGAHDVYLLLFAYGAANGLREWSLSSRGGTVTRCGAHVGGRRFSGSVQGARWAHPSVGEFLQMSRRAHREDPGAVAGPLRHRRPAGSEDNLEGYWYGKMSTVNTMSEPRPSAPARKTRVDLMKGI